MSTRKPDLLSYEIQAQELRRQAYADLARLAARAFVRTAAAVRESFRSKRTAAPATLPL